MDFFFKNLLIEIISNIDNDYHDNYDTERFVEKNKISIKKRIKLALTKFLGLKVCPVQKRQYLNSILHISDYFSGLSEVFAILEDDESKKLFTTLITYKILGERKVKLPLNTAEYWQGIQEMEKLKLHADFIDVPYVSGRNLRLHLFDLNKLNIPLKLYYTGSGVYSNLYVKQYEYQNKQINISPEEGDIVLDCGSCWGDTSLFFANKIGPQGHVYSFDFISDNVSVFNKNVNLNPDLKKRISLIQAPISIKSGEVIYYQENGPASKIVNQENTYTKSITTITIDEFCKSQNLKAIDFIKMDIEGAELSALKGGIDTIKKSRPKLAISIYHSMNDFVDIPVFLESLKLGYKFYLKHGTIHNEETVIIATCKS